MWEAVTTMPGFMVTHMFKRKLAALAHVNQQHANAVCVHREKDLIVFVERVAVIIVRPVLGA
jgi:hypothetical protein